MNAITGSLLLVPCLLLAGCTTGRAPDVLHAPYSRDVTRTIEIRNAGPSINTFRDDYAPFVASNARLYFVTAKQEGIERIEIGDRTELRDVINHTIYVAALKPGDDTTFGEVAALPYPINSRTAEGNYAASADGSVAVIVACDRSDGLGGCDLYQVLDPDSATPAVANLSEINSPYWDSAPTLSSDGRTLYFVSNGRGTIGGWGDTDIFVSRLGDDGKWSTPENLGMPVNTGLRQDSPFLVRGDSILFFSSESPTGYGGFDIFMARRRPEGGWGTPVNLGSPINTEADERYIAVPPGSGPFYFASTRKDVRNYGGFDIFIARFVP